MASPLEMESDLKFLDDVHGKEEENFSYALHLVKSSVFSMSLHPAIELGVFDIVAKAGEGAKLSPAEIAEQMATNNHEAPIMLDRLLRVLASHSVLNCSAVSDGNKASKFQRLYSLGAMSKYLVTNEDGVSLGPVMALEHDKIFLDSCEESCVCTRNIPPTCYCTYEFDSCSSPNAPATQLQQRS